MDKPTKKQVNYRLPEECCANCAFSSFNSYDDAMCTHLESGESTVDPGGYCDDWRVAT